MVTALSSRGDAEPPLKAASGLALVCHSNRRALLGSIAMA